MKKETLIKIKTNPLIYNYLREESHHYINLYKNDNYIKEIEKQAKKKYKQTNIDKIERLINNINLIKTFLSVID